MLCRLIRSKISGLVSYHTNARSKGERLGQVGRLVYTPWMEAVSKKPC